MHLNGGTALSARNVLLVPYCRHHVPAYHEWMQNADLREATASEELTLEEEYSMQKSWRNDHDKLTFIICKPLEDSLVGCHSIRAGQVDSASHMVGDINLFLFDEADDDDSEGRSQVVGEIELMIAGKGDRRQGYGRSALLVFLSYIASHQPEILLEHSGNTATPRSLAYLRVKINKSNTASISLFESAGFRLLSETANYFGELELRAGLETYLIKDREARDAYEQLIYETEEQ